MKAGLCKVFDHLDASLRGHCCSHNGESKRTVTGYSMNVGQRYISHHQGLHKLLTLFTIHVSLSGAHCITKVRDLWVNNLKGST